MALSAEEKKKDRPVEEEQVEAQTEPKAETTTSSKRPKTEAQPKDVEVNQGGVEAPTVERPGTPNIERAAVVFLARQLLTPSDLEDFKGLYPSLFE